MAIESTEAISARTTRITPRNRLGEPMAVGCWCFRNQMRLSAVVGGALTKQHMNLVFTRWSLQKGGVKQSAGHKQEGLTCKFLAVNLCQLRTVLDALRKDGKASMHATLRSTIVQCQSKFTVGCLAMALGDGRARCWQRSQTIGTLVDRGVHGRGRASPAPRMRQS